MSIKLNGATNGSVELDVPAAIGSDLSVTIPATAGELTVKATDGSVDLGDVNIDSSGRLLVGTSTSRSNNLGSNFQFQIEGTGGDTAGAALVRNSNNGGAPYFVLGKTRATSIGGSTAVSLGDGLGEFHFTGSDGTNLISAAIISAAVDGTPGANDMPGRIVLSTTADGASSPTERMRISQTGHVGFEKGIAIGSTTVSGGNESKFLIYSGVISSGAGNSTLKYNTSTALVTYDTSSRLVKENIVDCPYGIKALKQLQPRKYFRTDDQRDEIGFVADELVAVLPEFVPIGPKSVITKDENDTEEIPLGVNYEKLTAVLTKALQEAIGRIETLEAKVQTLEGGAS